jgi:hypothetical protein
VRAHSFQVLECQWLLEVPDTSSPKLWLHRVKQKGQFKRHQGGTRVKELVQGVLRQVGERMAGEKVAERVGQKLINGRDRMVPQQLG